MTGMSLRHALLGLLADRPGSGWDLLKRFEVSLAFVWPATQSQLYTELGRMTDEQLVEVISTGARNRKEYAITDTGRQELARWITDIEPERNRRNDALLRVFFLWAVDPQAARSYLEKEAAVFQQFHARLEQVEATVDWDDSAFDRYGRIALEHGLRLAATNEEWARWAANQVDLPAKPVKGGAVKPTKSRQA